VLLDGDEPRLNIMYVIAKVLVQCKSDGSEYFVVLHTIPTPNPSPREGSLVTSEGDLSPY